MCRNSMQKKMYAKKLLIKSRLVYIFISLIVLFSGIIIYIFFRNINNMIIFNFIPKPAFINALNIPKQPVSIWNQIFIYNLPYGLWCLSGLLLIRSIWLNNKKWYTIYRNIFIILVMSYVILKLPRKIPGTFDILDLVFMGLFAFLESIIYTQFFRR